MQNLGKIIGGTVAGVVGAVAIPVTLPLLGFTSAGVAAGSIAASIQSAVYGAWTGGVFALAQECFSENFDYQKFILSRTGIKIHRVDMNQNRVENMIHDLITKS